MKTRARSTTASLPVRPSAAPQRASCKIAWFLPLFLAAALLATAPLGAEQEEILPAGRYRLDMIMASATKIPFFGSARSVSKSVSLVEIRHGGGAVLQTHQVCDMRVLEASAIRIVFPEKFIAALARPSYVVRLEKDAQGWSYSADLGLERIGYRSNGAADKLPEKIDDGAVFDWDNDGYPAATIKLSVPLLPHGDLFIVQHGRSILGGRAVQPGRIQGGLEVRGFEHRVLGAKPAFLARSPEITPNSMESRFSLARLSAGANCQSLRASLES